LASVLEHAVGTTPVRPVRADARRNHDLLLSAASAVFAENGPEAALEEIARRAGVGIGTLYRHFPTREALMGAVVRERIFELDVAARRGLDAADPFEALATWLQEHLAFSTTKRGLLAGVVLLKQTGDADFQCVCDNMLSSMEALVLRAQAAHQMRADVSSRDLMHLISAIAAGAEHAGDPAMAQRLFAMTLDGLRTSP